MMFFIDKTITYYILIAVPYLNYEPYIYYTVSLTTELSLREQKTKFLKPKLNTEILRFFLLKIPKLY